MLAEENPIIILSPPYDPVLEEKRESVLHIVGGAELRGHVPISGAKNSALALMAASLLSSEGCLIENLPCLVDVQRMADILVSLGVKVQRQKDNIYLDTRHINTAQAPYELVSQMRASFFIIGPLLSRLGVAQIPLPGGCAIGARPVDLHVRGLQAMGAEVEISHGIVHASCPLGRLQGAKVYLDYPSVGATETIMMAATLAQGETVIQNAAQEPEVVDLANFCRTLGAKIYGAGSKTIVILGVPQLEGGEYRVIPDRIEAGTYMIAGAITRSDITLSPVVPEHLIAVTAKLKEIGVRVEMVSPSMIRVEGSRSPYNGIEIETSPFPGFPTDMQAQLMALLTISQGNSVITETVFENRLQHVAELCRMGANIRTKGNVAIISGVEKLSGAPVMATDLRASAALVLAGLAAEGETQLRGLHHLDRGYDRLEEKLRDLGASLHRD